jgi:hypothetical protein
MSFKHLTIAQSYALNKVKKYSWKGHIQAYKEMGYLQKEIA